MAKKMTIYSITGDILALKALADEAMADPETGEAREITDEERKEFLAWISENEANLEEKMNGIYKVCCNLKAEAAAAEAEREAVKKEADRLGKRAKARENDVKRVKGLFAYAMEKLKMRKYKTALFSVGWQACAKSAKPREGFFDIDKIPLEYVKRELSASAVSAAVKEGRLFEKEGDDRLRGRLFYFGHGGAERELEGVSWTGGETLVLR